MNVIEPNNPFNQAFADIAKTFAKPKEAILMISTHWNSSKLQIEVDR